MIGLAGAMLVAAGVIVRAHNARVAAVAADEAAKVSSAESAAEAAAEAAAPEHPTPTQMRMDTRCLREMQKWIAHTEATKAAGLDRPDISSGTAGYVGLIRFMETILGPIAVNGWSRKSSEEMRAAFVSVPGCPAHPAVDSRVQGPYS